MSIARLNPQASSRQASAMRLQLNFSNLLQCYVGLVRRETRSGCISSTLRLTRTNQLQLMVIWLFNEINY